MRKKILLAILPLIALFPTVVSANIVWPSIYIAEGMRSLGVILSGFLIETIFVKIYEKQTWLRAVLISVIMNTSSTLIGIILIPAIGFAGTLLLGFLSEYIPALGNTFDTPLWIFSYLLTVFANVFVEGSTTQYAAKIPFKKTFWWLLAANTLSVLICILVHGFTLDAFMK